MFWGLIETQAEKELKKLQAEVAAKAVEEAKAKAAAEAKAAEEAKKEVTLQDVQAVATKYGQKILAQATETGSELLAEAGNTTVAIKNTVVEEFNKQGSKAIIAAVEAAYAVSKKAAGLKKKALKILKK